MIEKYLRIHITTDNKLTIKNENDIFHRLKIIDKDFIKSRKKKMKIVVTRRIKKKRSRNFRRLTRLYRITKNYNFILKIRLLLRRREINKI